MIGRALSHYETSFSGEVAEGIGWTLFRGYTDDMLRALFPLRWAVKVGE